MDLVGHVRGNTWDEFFYNLNATDLATGWTEVEGVKNYPQVWVFEALEKIKGRLPFKLLRIDSDNDSAFINAHLLRYGEESHLTFTRSRVNRKNDNWLYRAERLYGGKKNRRLPAL